MRVGQSSYRKVAGASSMRAAVEALRWLVQRFRCAPVDFGGGPFPHERQMVAG
jgi:hypothetical protein